MKAVYAYTWDAHNLTGNQEIKRWDFLLRVGKRKSSIIGKYRRHWNYLLLKEM